MMFEELTNISLKSHGKDQQQYGRRFISTSLSSSSDDEYIIILTASSVDLGDTSSEDECSDSEFIDQRKTMISDSLQLNQSESSGVSSGTLTMSGHSSLESNSGCKDHDLEVSSHYQDSDASCSIQEADVSSSCMDDETSYEDSDASSLFEDESIGFVVHPSDVCSEESRQLDDEIDSSCVGFPLPNLPTFCDQNLESIGIKLSNCNSDSSDEEITGSKGSYSDSNACIKQEHGSVSSLGDSPFQFQESISSPSISDPFERLHSKFCNDFPEIVSENCPNIKGSQSKITISNISKINDEQVDIKREDFIANWVVCSQYNSCNSIEFSSSESSESFDVTTKASDFEELGFHDTFAAFPYFKRNEDFVSSKNLASLNSDWQANFSHFEERQRKVSFAPPDKLVTIYHFKYTAEEMEEDISTISMRLDAIRFKRRITEFTEMISPFLTKEYRSAVMKRNGLQLYQLEY